jgi:amidase
MEEKSPARSIKTADFASNIETYLLQLKTNPNNIMNVSSLRDYTRNTPQEDYPSTNTGYWDMVLDSQKWTNKDAQFRGEYAMSVDYATNKGLLMALKKWNLDAIVLPTYAAPSWAAVIGAPIITVPLGAYPAEYPTTDTERGDMVVKAPGIP